MVLLTLPVWAVMVEATAWAAYVRRLRGDRFGLVADFGVGGGIADGDRPGDD